MDIPRGRTAASIPSTLSSISSSRLIISADAGSSLSNQLASQRAKGMKCLRMSNTVGALPAFVRRGIQIDTMTSSTDAKATTRAVAIALDFPYSTRLAGHPPPRALHHLLSIPGMFTTCPDGHWGRMVQTVRAMAGLPLQMRHLVHGVTLIQRGHHSELVRNSSRRWDGGLGTRNPKSGSSRNGKKVEVGRRGLIDARIARSGIDKEAAPAVTGSLVL